MPRQQTIASFFHRPSPDCLGADTPPERSQPRLSANSSDVVVRPFSSIMHKFVKRVSLDASPGDCAFTSPG